MWKVLGSWVNRYFGEEEAVLLALLLAVALVVVATMGEIMAPFVAALIFAFLLQGGVNRLERLKVPRLVAVTLVLPDVHRCLFSYFDYPSPFDRAPNCKPSW